MRFIRQKTAPRAKTVQERRNRPSNASFAAINHRENITVFLLAKGVRVFLNEAFDAIFRTRAEDTGIARWIFNTETTASTVG